MLPLPIAQPHRHSSPLVLPFTQIGAADIPYVGGKGANLGELTRAGFAVPPGFCVTTAAFQHFISACPNVDELYALLASLRPGDVEATRRISRYVREQLQRVRMPLDVSAAILEAWPAVGSDYAYAVRSSATAEDLPDASFAGQQDTYLNVRGQQALLEHIRACWISLFTDRAVLYRLQNRFDQRAVALSVVVQRMLEPDISGIMFTADPVSGHRQIVSIDASFGLGEALVGGLVSADLYQVDKRRGRVVKRQISDKQIAIRALPGGGVEQVALDDGQRRRPALSEAQALELARLGSQIEAHYGTPQDIEWASENGQFYVLQARPITSLFPLPEPAPSDDALHVYMSFSHLQVMTDPMPEMSLSLWRLLFPIGRPDGVLENPKVCAAGGRIYVDVSAGLRHPLLKRMIPNLLISSVEPLMGQALRLLSDRAEFQQHGERADLLAPARWMAPLLGRIAPRLLWRAPEGMADAVLRQMAQQLARAERDLAAALVGAERLKVALRLLRTAFTEIVLEVAPYGAAGLIASRLLQRLASGFDSSEDVVAVMRGLQGNVTTDMDLAVGDLADVMRRSSALIHHFSQTGIDAETLLATAGEVAGAPAFLAAWEAFLQRYGMRGPSEIDISRPRWREDPTSLLQMALGSAQRAEAGGHRAHFERMVAEGEAAAERLVQRAGRGPWGRVRGPIVRRLVRVTRHLLPMREHHKYVLVHLIDSVKRAIYEAAEALVDQRRLEQRDDVWFLTLPELIASLEQPQEDVRERIARRRAEFARFREMAPPRVITSDGEIPAVAHAAVDAPADALLGSPVSAGVVEGLAHVVVDPQTEVVQPGEILVAPFTDPGWTPLFINAAGLVTEVGGLMTHGSVVAREYGIPAVVGVVDATKRIRTGQRIRVHGGVGYVELIDAKGVEPGITVATEVASL